MLTAKKMKEYIDKYGITYGEISEGTGVPISTVQKIFGGIVKKPRRETLENLSGFFLQFMKDGSGFVAEQSGFNTVYSKGSSAVDTREGLSSGVLYTQSGYTFNDYSHLKLPEGVRVEVLDGRLIRMDAPTTRHQVIAGEIYRLASNFIRASHGKCIPLISPVDVRLEYKDDGSDMTIFEPDVIIVCDKKKIEGLKTVNGSPDFVVEVASPSSRKYDMNDKMNKYRTSGVREFWLVDYDRNKIIKYTFEGDGDIFIYTFDDVVPVEIYDGKLAIDFGEIKEYIESIF